MIRCVVVESPLEFQTPRLATNLRYLERCIRDCALRDESPYASHRMLMGSVEDSNDIDKRALGLRLGFAIGRRLDAWIFYIDRGVTSGMIVGLTAALRIREDLPSKKRRIEFRSFGALGLPEVEIDAWRSIRSLDDDISTHEQRASTVSLPRAAEAFPVIDACVREHYPEMLP